MFPGATSSERKRIVQATQLRLSTPPGLAWKEWDQGQVSIPASSGKLTEGKGEPVCSRKIGGWSHFSLHGAALYFSYIRLSGKLSKITQSMQKKKFEAVLNYFKILNPASSLTRGNENISGQI